MYDVANVLILLFICKSKVFSYDVAKKLSKCLVVMKESFTFAPENKKKVTMRNYNVYFYGFYFYFADNCEAQGRM